MLIVILETICCLGFRLLHQPTLYGHQFFRMLVRIVLAFKSLLTFCSLLVVPFPQACPKYCCFKFNRFLSTKNERHASKVLLPAGVLSAAYFGISLKYLYFFINTFVLSTGLYSKQITNKGSNCHRYCAP
jgi:hypothetical protein